MRVCTQSIGIGVRLRLCVRVNQANKKWKKCVLTTSVSFEITEKQQHIQSVVEQHS